jgi:hypothetical protein
MEIPEQACLMKKEVSILIIGTFTFVIVTLTAALLLFSYRWHFRLLCFEAFRGRGERLRQRLLQQEFDFDVFVSYDSYDFRWVQQHLMPELEDRQGLRLCIHERDSIPGEQIVDNIAKCVERSKKVMMVFSRNFNFSEWCQFELMYCLTHVMDYDDSLVIIVIDDITRRRMTAAMTAVLKTTTYIQWAEHQDAIYSFWGRVRLALADIMPNGPANRRRNPNVQAGHQIMNHRLLPQDHIPLADVGLA